MKFSAKKYPVLDDIKKGFKEPLMADGLKVDLWNTKGYVGAKGNWEGSSTMGGAFIEMVSAMPLENIYYLSKPVLLKLQEKQMQEKMSVFRYEIKPERGVFLISGDALKYIIYDVRMGGYAPKLNGIEQKGKRVIDCTFATGSEDGLDIVFQTRINEEINKMMLGGFASRSHGMQEEGMIFDYMKCYTIWVLQYIAFKQFAPIETKIIQKGKQRKVTLGKEKHLNETTVPIQIIDSHWFRNIIRTEGFNVRGHFRLQPCGEGRKERKLVWINEYEKSGYFRTAKKLNP